MRGTLLGSLTLIALGWMAGCGGSSGASSTGGMAQPNALNGQYAFVLSGFDSNANPMGVAGSFKADGLGHITGGAVDVNDNGVVSSSSALTGTYVFDTNGQGTIGTITLTNSVGSVTHPLAFGFALQANGALGDIIGLDTNNFIVAGTMQQQNSSVFTLSSLAGDYVVTLNGRNAAVPTSALGRFTLGSNAASTNVVFDRSISGVGTAGPTTGSSVALTFASAGPDTNGRGTLTVTLNDALTTGTQNFAYYAITANRFVAVETDSAGTMIADASRQSTPFTATTVNTAGAVFGIAGIDTVASNEISAVGQLQVVGTNGGTLGWDSNDNGGIVTIPTLASQPVTFNASTGRGTVTVASGAANGLADSLVLYLTAPGTGLVMDATPGATNRAMAGTLTAQTGAPFSTATDLSGVAIVRSRGSSVNDADAFVGEFGPTSSSTYAFVVDQRFPGSSGIQTSTDASIPGITVATLNASTGRGTLLIPVGNLTETLAFYVIGPNQFAFIDISPVGSGENGASSLFFGDPH